MSYDRADWHYGGDYPKELPPENGGTHIGMFLAWAIMNGLEGDELQEDSAPSLAAVRARQMTGRQFLFRECDEKLWEADFNDEGSAFATAYYQTSNQDFSYHADYGRIFEDVLPGTYYVEDTWQNYDKIAAEITRRFEEWKLTKR
jgi:hypothetical protein